MLRQLLLATTLIAATAMAQTTGNLVFPGETDPLMLQWGQETVEGFLSIHGMEATEASTLSTWGRQDVRDNLRSFAWARLYMQLSDTGGTKSAADQRVLSRYAAAVKDARVRSLDIAVQERDRFRSNYCTWKPDPDLAKAANYSYDGAYYCPRSVYAGMMDETSPPAFPPKEYFVALGQRKAWIDPIASRSGGLRSISHITLGGALILGIGIPVALAAGALVVSAGGALSIVRILSPFAKVAKVLSKAGQSASSATRWLGWVGFGISVAITLVVIVIMVYIYTENERILRGQDSLNADRTAAQNEPVPGIDDLNRLAQDSNGVKMLFAVFCNMVIPSTNVASTLPLPTPNPGVDPVFVVRNPSGGATSEEASITFGGWDGEKYRTRMWRGWFLKEAVVGASGVDSTSIDTRFRYRWNGKKYELSRLGYFLAVRKNDPDTTDVECPADPATGLSTAADFTKCRHFFATQVSMDLDGVGTRQVSISQQIQFVSEMNTGVAHGTGEQIQINATGLPTPIVSLTSSLPAGFTFQQGTAGGSVLTYNGSAVPVGEYSFTVKAANVSSSKTATLKVNVVDKVRWVSPVLSDGNTPQAPFAQVKASFTRPIGESLDIVLKAAGTPAPRITMTNAFPDRCGLLLSGGSTGTARLSGKVAKPGYFNTDRCILSFLATNDITFQNLEVTIITTPPVTQPVLVSTWFEARPAYQTELLVQTAGASGPVSISLTKDSGGRQLAPSWVTLQDQGNGTAKMTIFPPINAPEQVVVPLWYRVTNTDGNLASSATDGVLLKLSKTPEFSAPSKFAVMDTDGSTFQTFSTTAAYNDNGSMGIVGGLPSGLQALNSVATTLLIIGKPRDPGDHAVTAQATNPWGSVTQPVRIIATKAAQITSPNRVNFYIGKPNQFIEVLTSGFPLQPLMDAPEGAPAPMRIWTDTLPGSVLPNIPGLPGAGTSVLPPGMQLLPGNMLLLTKNLATSEDLYGRALISGSPSVAGIWPFKLYAQTAGLAVATQDFTLVITYQGDVNGDFQVNCADLAFINARMGRRRGMPSYDYNADYNQDGVIDVKDLALVSARLPAGVRCQ